MNTKINTNPFRSLGAAIIVLVAMMILNINSTCFAQETVEQGSAPTVASAQVPIVEEVPPLYSMDLLRHWMMDRSRSGWISVWSKTIDWSYNGTTSKNVVGESGEQVLKALSAVVLDFRLGNPNDQVEISASLQDLVGSRLFEGWSQVSASAFENGTPFVKLWAQDQAILNGVITAEVLVTGDDGATVKKIQLDVKAGKAIFPNWLSERANGILSVRYSDGRVVLYPLWKQGGTSPVGFAGDSGLGVANHFIYSDPTAIQLRLTQEKPSVYIEMSKDGVVDFDIAGLVYDKVGQYWEKPTRFNNFKTGIDTPLSQQGVSVVPLAKGKYRLTFHWDKFGNPGTIYTGPDSPTEGEVAIKPTPVDGIGAEN